MSKKQYHNFYEQQKKINKFFKEIKKTLHLLDEFVELTKPIQKYNLFITTSEIQEKFSEIFGIKAYEGKEMDFKTAYNLRKIYRELFFKNEKPLQKLIDATSISMKTKERKIK